MLLLLQSVGEICQLTKLREKQFENEMRNYSTLAKTSPPPHPPADLTVCTARSTVCPLLIYGHSFTVTVPAEKSFAGLQFIHIRR